ncbi:MAG: ParA family protein [Rhodospirillales bacterium]|jgi:chromosome partitioning protein|nr:ParA family protein [Rhodospirillales bacterium]
MTAAARVLTIAQQKGGAGKTTLAAHLAVAFVRLGRRVALLDIDPQASLAAWFKLRSAHAKPKIDPLMLSEIAGWRLGTEISRLKAQSDLIIIDSPPHAETEAKIAVRSANLVLVPVQPSPMDVWATGPTVELARAAGVPVLAVLNRVPPRGTIVEQMRSALAAHHLAIATTVIGNRIAFAASMLAGQSILEHAPRAAAAREIKALAEEIAARLA